MQIKLPKRADGSHKGQQGRVLVVGGSKEYYGAPILAALGAEYSGADLISLSLPKQNESVAKHYSLNFFIRPFKGEDLSDEDVQSIVDYSKRQHALVIGNGLGQGNSDTKAALLKILEQIKISTVVDADGIISEILGALDRKVPTAITPHAGEFRRLFNCEPTKENVVECAKKHQLTILLKGSTDFVASQDGVLYENKTGCPEMRVGGTGDVLSGIVGSFISQGLTPFEACCSAAFCFGKCGEFLKSNRLCLTAHQAALNLTHILWLLQSAPEVL